MHKSGSKILQKFFFSLLSALVTICFTACDSSEVGYPQDTNSIALTTLSGKSRNTRFVFYDNMSYLETAVINGTDEDIKKDESQKSGAWRIRKGYMLDVGKDYRSGFIMADHKTRVIATLDDNEENETSLCVSFQRSSYMTSSNVSGDYHLNRLTWGGGGGSFSLSRGTMTFDGVSKMTSENITQYYRVSDDGTLRFGSDETMSGMIGMDGSVFFANTKDDRGNAYDYSIGIKKSSGLSTASLKGNYYACEIGKNPQKVFAQRSNLVFDGSGSFTDQNADDTEQEATGGTYSVADDGSISIDGNTGTGSISSDGKFLILLIERAGDWRYIIARKI